MNRKLFKLFLTGIIAFLVVGCSGTNVKTKEEVKNNNETKKEIVTKKFSKQIPTNIKAEELLGGKETTINEEAFVTLQKNEIAEIGTDVKNEGEYIARINYINLKENNMIVFKDSTGKVIGKVNLEKSSKKEEVETNIIIKKDISKILILPNDEVNISKMVFKFLKDRGIQGMQGNAYIIKAANENKILGLNADGNIELIDNTNSKEGIWEFKIGGNGYRLENKKVNLLLSDNEKLFLNNWVNQGWQTWIIEKAYDNKFYIINRKTGRVLKHSGNLVSLEDIEKEEDTYLWEIEKSNYKIENKIEDKREYKLVWADEFEKDGLPDENIWTFEVWKPKKVNNELQAYTDRRLENCRVENGKLIIEARMDNFNGFKYTSARIVTDPRRRLNVDFDKVPDDAIGHWKYGKFVMRAKMPHGRGTWPAFWMMPTNPYFYGKGWPGCGEIDIHEYVGYDKDYANSALHCLNGNFMHGTQRTARKYKPGLEDDFHEYTLEWTEDYIRTFIDDEEIGTFYNNYGGWEDWPWDKHFYIILNFAVGGNWGGAKGVDDSIWPQKFEIDYIKVYQKK